MFFIYTFTFLNLNFCFNDRRVSAKKHHCLFFQNFTYFFLFHKTWYQGSPSCDWDVLKVTKYILTGNHLGMTSSRIKRSASDSQPFNLNSLMTSMADLSRQRISGVNQLMKTLLNGTSGSSNSDSMNALLLSGRFYVVSRTVH